MKGDLNIRFLQSNGIQEESAKQEISWKMRRDKSRKYRMHAYALYHQDNEIGGR